MDKNIRLSMLLELYGKLLTPKQYDAIDFYYNQNLSLGEIAENEGITRQGVRKNLLEAEKNLFDYESKLHFLDERLARNKLLEELISETKDSKLKEKLQRLL
jgi:predicted DNA-binding protein YlxM (UPF0122 family)